MVEMEEEVRNLMTRYGILEVRTAVDQICEKIYADLKIMYEKQTEEKKEPPKRKYERKKEKQPPASAPIQEPKPEPIQEPTEKKRKLIKKANIVVEKGGVGSEAYI